MKSIYIARIKRGSWYLLGVIFFFAPVALFQRFVMGFFGLSGRTDFHEICLRMPIYDLFLGKLELMLSVSLFSVILLTVVAIFFGPLFCGKLCATGALPEYLSYVIPDRLKIDWGRIVNPIPVRYGFFAAYFLTPFIVGSTICCAYCNFSFMQKLLLGGFWGSFGVLSSTAIINALLWLVILGVFTKAGRGYCNFLCPVGAYQNLLYSISARFPFSYKLQYDKEKCTNCGLCVQECPMRSLSQNSKRKVDHQIHNCILCQNCKEICPTKAISYNSEGEVWGTAQIDSSGKGCLDLK